MAFSLSNQNGHTAYGIKEYTCDTQEDIKDLPIDCKPGSTAFVIQGTVVYMLNNAHVWTKI